MKHSQKVLIQLFVHCHLLWWRGKPPTEILPLFISLSLCWSSLEKPKWKKKKLYSYSKTQVCYKIFTVYWEHLLRKIITFVRLDIKYKHTCTHTNVCTHTHTDWLLQKVFPSLPGTLHYRRLHCYIITLKLLSPLAKNMFYLYLFSLCFLSYTVVLLICCFPLFLSQEQKIKAWIRKGQ